LIFSLGGGFSKALNRAVDAAVANNVFVAVAAGNEDQDACQVSPASAGAAFTVGASDVSDNRAYFSNWGECVNIFAPGHHVYSAKHDNKEQYWFASGTSMATPHVAGAAAALWSGLPANTPVEKLHEIMAARATKDSLADVSGSPNLLLHIHD
jgi:subtilisin family serine protease